MSSDFIVSARKYRPQTFRSVVGQSHITETLRNAIAKGQMAHAYLFTGPRGVGKTTCARIFARSINCLNPTDEFEACGECESCISFANDRSFNIHEMDAASNNSVDDIRILTDKVRVAPQIGKYSIYIIDEVHMLSSAAFNAFLKTLEEPPAHAIFILATTEKHKILPTILSRCQIYDFNRITVEDIVEYLRYITSLEGVTYDDESLYIIAQKADGGMRDALSTFDRVVSFCGSDLQFSKVAQSIGTLDYNTYFSAVEMALQGDYGSLLMLYDGVISRGIDGQYFLGGFAEHFRNLIVAKSPQTQSLLELSGGLAAQYVSQAEVCEINFLFSSVNLLTGADASYRGSTARRLLVELTLMKMAGLAASTGVVAPKMERAVLPKISATIQPARTQPAVTTQPDAQPTVQPAVQPTVQPTVQPVQQQAQPTIQPTIQPIAQPTVQPTAQPAATPVQQQSNPSTLGGSMFGISIKSNGKDNGNEAPKQEVKQQKETVVQLTPEQISSKIKEGFSTLIELWEKRNKPRTTMVLKSAEIGLDTIQLFVPNSIMENEIINSKLEIESDMNNLFGYHLPLEVILREEVVLEHPVTIEQRIQHLVNANEKLLDLQKAFDLTH